MLRKKRALSEPDKKSKCFVLIAAGRAYPGMVEPDLVRGMSKERFLSGIRVALFGCRSGQLYLVGIDYGIFELGAELRVDGMNDVAVGAVGIFPAWHDNEIAVACMNDLDIVYGERVVEGNRDNGLHGALFKKLTDFDISDLHEHVLPRGSEYWIAMRTV